MSTLCRAGHGHPGTRAVPTTHLWFVRFPGVGCVQLSEDTLGFGKERLLSVNVVDPGLPAAKHQDHRTWLQTWWGWGEMGGAVSPGTTNASFLQAASLQICQQPQRPAQGCQEPSLAKLGWRENQHGGGNALPEPVRGLGSHGRAACARFWGEIKLFFFLNGLNDQ